MDQMVFLSNAKPVVRLVRKSSSHFFVRFRVQGLGVWGLGFYFLFVLLLVVLHACYTQGPVFP